MVEANDTAKLAAERIVEQRVRQARQEEVLAVYEDLLATIWQRLVPTLGRATVIAMMDRALSMTAETHSCIQGLTVTPEGMAFDGFRETPAQQRPGEVRVAMKEFVANLIDLLAMLTGDIIVRHLLNEMECGR